MLNFFVDSDEEETPKIKKKPKANLEQINYKSKKNLTAEEYKLEHDQYKRKYKRKELQKNQKNGENKDETPKESKKEINQSKIPYIITILQKKTKEEIKISLEELIDQEYIDDKLNENKIEIKSFPQEKDVGNIEYKLKLVNPSMEKFQNLTTQMKYRLNEGYGVCYYKIGVEDNGNPLGIPKEMMLTSLRTLCGMASCLKAEIVLLKMKKGLKGKHAHLMVRQGQKEGIKLDIRIMLLGDFESGKSTLIGVLTSGTYDNGKGLARMKVLSHKHEVLSGQTSSLSHHILGFDNQGNIVNHSSFTTSTWEEIVDMSTKLLTFIDIGGHEKYSKSLVLGLCSQSPQYALLVISAINNLSKITEQHFKLANLSQIPLIIVITHTDVASETQIDELVMSINELVSREMKDKYTIVIKNIEDIVLVSRLMGKEDPIPIFLVSNTNGKNHDLFTGFLNLLPSLNSFENSINLSTTEFFIQQKFEHHDLPILAGTVLKGTVRKGQILEMGPNNKGEFMSIEVIGIQCKRIPVRSATCGQICTIAIKPAEKSSQPWNPQSEIRRGMVLVGEKHAHASYEFLAEIKIFDSNEEKILKQNYQPVINTQTTRQSCKMIITQEEKFEVLKLTKVKSKSIDMRNTTNTNKTKKKIKEDNFIKKRHKMSMDFLVTNDFSKPTEEKNNNCNNKPILTVPEKNVNKINLNACGQQTENNNVSSEIYKNNKFNDNGNNFERKASLEDKKEFEVITEEGKNNLKNEKCIIVKPDVCNFIRLRFIYYPEYITVGQKLIINDSCLKAIGWIREIFY